MTAMQSTLDNAVPAASPQAAVPATQAVSAKTWIAVIGAEFSPMVSST